MIQSHKLEICKLMLNKLLFRLCSKTERNRESTKAAIQFALGSKKQAFNSLFIHFDKKTGRIDKSNFDKVLTTMGVF